MMMSGRCGQDGGDGDAHQTLMYPPLGFMKPVHMLSVPVWKGAMKGLRTMTESEDCTTNQLKPHALSSPSF